MKQDCKAIAYLPGGSLVNNSMFKQVVSLYLELYSITILHTHRKYFRAPTAGGCQVKSMTGPATLGKHLGNYFDIAMLSEVRLLVFLHGGLLLRSASPSRPDKDTFSLAGLVKYALQLTIVFALEVLLWSRGMFFIQLETFRLPRNSVWPATCRHVRPARSGRLAF